MLILEAQTVPIIVRPSDYLYHVAEQSVQTVPVTAKHSLNVGLVKNLTRKKMLLVIIKTKTDKTKPKLNK